MSPLLAAVIALYCYQLSYGSYLGRGWGIAAGAGIATAVALNAAVWISIRRHRAPMGRLMMAWLVLAVMSASAIRFPFPKGRYGNVQAFFNVVHAAMLGFEAVTVTAIIALMLYAVARPRSAARREAPAGLITGRAEDPDQVG